MSISKKLMTAGGGSKATYVDDLFSTYLYTGTGVERDIENGIDLAGKGGLVWVKQRDNSSHHILTDTARGPSKVLWTDAADYERDEPTYVNEFNATGFGVGTGSEVNANNRKYASWTFRKAPKFFDVVTYTGNGTFGAEVPHNLGAEAGFVAVKPIDNTSDWICWHKDVGTEANGFVENLILNEPSARVNYGMVNRGNQGTDWSKNIWLASNSEVNGDGIEYVAFVWAHDDSDESMIKCGTYTGNGNADGPEIDLGFEPQWLLVKRTDSSSYWAIIDVVRGIVHETTKVLRPNESLQEVSGTEVMFQPTPTGFVAGGSQMNSNLGEYIYMAIRRPNKPAEEFEAEELFAIAPTTSTDPQRISGFPTDMGLTKNVTDTAGPYVWSRLREGYRLTTSTTGQESFDGGTGAFDYPNGMTANGNAGASTDHLAYMWRRAPGFFDMVSYTGVNSNGASPHTIAHSLGVQPEMIWVKATAQSYNWVVYQRDMGADRYLRINQIDNRKISDEAFYDTEPTADVFTVGYDNAVNNNNYKYLAYLFASLPGVSKIGTYEGNGSNDGPIVECGFVPRLIVSKNIDGNGTWNVIDADRGFNRVFYLNSNGAQVTDTLYAQTASGFQVVNGGGNVNTSGQNYLFYALA